MTLCCHFMILCHKPYLAWGNKRFFYISTFMWKKFNSSLVYFSSNSRSILHLKIPGQFFKYVLRVVSLILGVPFLSRFLHTVWMKILTIFSVDMHLLHHYNRNFAHISAFYSLVIGLQNVEIWDKKDLKWKTRCISTKISHF